MSYARVGGDSDIYFYCCGTGDPPVFECASCYLAEEGEFPMLISGADNAIAHIKDHIKAGHKVPIDTIDLLKGDWRK